MKIKQKTRDELLTEKVHAEKSYENLLFQDRNIRKEFARAFNWREPAGAFDYNSSKIGEPSWSQVFVELGKLLASRDFRGFEGNVSDLECRVDNLEKIERDENNCKVKRYDNI